MRRGIQEPLYEHWKNAFHAEIRAFDAYDFDDDSCALRDWWAACVSAEGVAEHYVDEYELRVAERAKRLE